MPNKITMDDIFNKLKTLDQNTVIVDVRTPDEFAEGHVPGSKNFPVDEIDQHAQELKKYSEIYVYCRSGGRVGVAAQILGALGVKNLNCVLSGGFPNWAARGYEIEFD